MSEYKTLSQWFDEIGLAAGMVFEPDSINPKRLIIEKFENEKVYWTNSFGDKSVWHFTEFNDNYKLIFDPRSENKSEKETVEKSFKDILRKNTQKVIDKENEEKENEYKQFSETMKKTLREISQKNKNFYYLSDNELAERFCKENGLKYEYIHEFGFHHKISWE